MSDQVTGTAYAAGAVAIVFGGWGLAVAGEAGWVAARGVRLGAFVHLSLTGALLLLAIGLLAVGGARTRAPVLITGAAIASAVGALVGIVGAGRDGNLLGATGSTVSLLIGLTAALGVLALIGRPDDRGDRLDQP